MSAKSSRSMRRSRRRAAHSTSTARRSCISSARRWTGARTISQPASSSRIQTRPAPAAAARASPSDPCDRDGVSLAQFLLQFSVTAEGGLGMSRAAALLFAILAYAIFFATFLYLICFVGDLAFAPITVDVGPQAPVPVAVAIDIALIALFGLQHSVMARPGFKRWWTRFVPPPVERSVYVLCA